MVFRWLFGGSTAASPAADAPSSSESDEYVAGGLEGATGAAPLGPGDSTPDALGPDALGPDALGEHPDVPTNPTQVPLTAIPSFMVEDRPELGLSPYDLSRGQYAANVQALVHNAVRVEMADMWGFILPSLQSRCEADVENGLTEADGEDVMHWWNGFARFALTASLVDDMVNKKAFDDVYVGFDKETKDIQKLFLKVQEKNNVHLEMAVRKMAKAAKTFEDEVSATTFTGLVKAWQMLASMLADIYAESEALVKAIDRWVRNPFEYKDLEKQAARIFTNKKRWGDDDSKRGEMIVILCRWVGTEELMRDWMFRNLTKRELRSIDKWMDDYRDRRLAITDRFHQKKV